MKLPCTYVTLILWGIGYPKCQPVANVFDMTEAISIVNG